MSRKRIKPSTNISPHPKKKKKKFDTDVPRHLLTTEDAEILKNVVLHSVATAFASIVCKQDMIIYLTSKISIIKIARSNNIRDSNHFLTHSLLGISQDKITRRI